jgi:hypothetical protein
LLLLLPPPGAPKPKILPELDDEPERLAVPDETPVTTWSLGCNPLRTTVLVPSLIPVSIGTRTGEPLRSTYTALP